MAASRRSKPVANRTMKVRPAFKKRHSSSVTCRRMAAIGRHLIDRFTLVPPDVPLAPASEDPTRSARTSRALTARPPTRSRSRPASATSLPAPPAGRRSARGQGRKAAFRTTKISTCPHARHTSSKSASRSEKYRRATSSHAGPSRAIWETSPQVASCRY